MVPDAPCKMAVRSLESPDSIIKENINQIMQITAFKAIWREELTEEGAQIDKKKSETKLLVIVRSLFS